MPKSTKKRMPFLMNNYYKKMEMVNGKIETPELDDMFPHIDENELEELRKTAENVR